MAALFGPGDGLEEALKSIEKIEGLADLNHEVDLARSFTMKNSNSDGKGTFKQHAFKAGKSRGALPKRLSGSIYPLRSDFDYVQGIKKGISVIDGREHSP